MSRETRRLSVDLKGLESNDDQELDVRSPERTHSVEVPIVDSRGSCGQPSEAEGSSRVSVGNPNSTVRAIGSFHELRPSPPKATLPPPPPPLEEESSISASKSFHRSGASFRERRFSSGRKSPIRSFARGIRSLITKPSEQEAQSSSSLLYLKAPTPKNEFRGGPPGLERLVMPPPGMEDFEKGFSPITMESEKERGEQMEIKGTGSSAPSFEEEEVAQIEIPPPPPPFEPEDDEEKLMQVEMLLPPPLEFEEELTAQNEISLPPPPLDSEEDEEEPRQVEIPSPPLSALNEEEEEVARIDIPSFGFDCGQDEVGQEKISQPSHLAEGRKSLNGDSEDQPLFALPPPPSEDDEESIFESNSEILPPPAVPPPSENDEGNSTAEIVSKIPSQTTEDDETRSPSCESPDGTGKSTPEEVDEGRVDEGRSSPILLLPSPNLESVPVKESVEALSATSNEEKIDHESGKKSEIQKVLLPLPPQEAEESDENIEIHEERRKLERPKLQSAEEEEEASSQSCQTQSRNAFFESARNEESPEVRKELDEGDEASSLLPPPSHSPPSSLPSSPGSITMAPPKHPPPPSLTRSSMSSQALIEEIQTPSRPPSLTSNQGSDIVATLDATSLERRKLWKERFSRARTRTLSWIREIEPPNQEYSWKRAASEVEEEKRPPSRERLAGKALDSIVNQIISRRRERKRSNSPKRPRESMKRPHILAQKKWAVFRTWDTFSEEDGNFEKKKMENGFENLQTLLERGRQLVGVKLFGDIATICESKGLQQLMDGILEDLVKGLVVKCRIREENSKSRWEENHLWVNHTLQYLCWSAVTVREKKDMLSVLSTNSIHLRSVASLHSNEDFGTITVIASAFTLRLGSKRRPTSENLHLEFKDAPSSLYCALTLLWNLAHLSRPC